MNFTRMYVLLVVCLLSLTGALILYANAHPEYAACHYDVAKSVFVCDKAMDIFTCDVGDDSHVFAGATVKGECQYFER
jgi:hypothetical protein